MHPHVTLEPLFYPAETFDLDPIRSGLARRQSRPARQPDVVDRVMHTDLQLLLVQIVDGDEGRSPGSRGDSRPNVYGC